VGSEFKVQLKISFEDRKSGSGFIAKPLCAYFQALSGSNTRITLKEELLV